MDFRSIINLLENGDGSAGTPAELFMQDLHANSQDNFFNPRQRVVGGALVEVSPSYEPDSVHISDVLSTDPGKGHGNAAMKFLCDLADKHGVTLDLTAEAYLKGPQAKGRLSTDQLVQWYGKFGFVNGDYGDMVRKPAGATMPAPKDKTPPSTTTDENGRTVIKLRGLKKRPH